MRRCRELRLIFSGSSENHPPYGYTPIWRVTYRQLPRRYTIVSMILMRCAQKHIHRRTRRLVSTPIESAELCSLLLMLLGSYSVHCHKESVLSEVTVVIYSVKTTPRYTIIRKISEISNILIDIS